MTGLLFTLVTYVSAGGIYLNEGEAEGLKVGDAIEVGAARLTIEEVATHTARTTSPPDLFTIKIGQEVVVKRGPRPAKVDAVVEAEVPKPRPPTIDDGDAVGLWSGADDGWREPEAEARVAKRYAAQRTRYLSVMSLAGGVYEGGGYSTTWTGLNSRLSLRSGHWGYAHDLRLRDDARGTVLEAHRLEGAWRRDTWGVSGGRMFAATVLAGTSVDGASLQVGSVRLFAGAVPDTADLRPEAKRPRLAMSVAGDRTWGDVKVRGQVAGELTGYDGQVDRIAVAPRFELRLGRLSATAQVNVDLNQDTAPDDRRPILLSRIYGAVQGTVGRVNASVRFDQRRRPFTLADEADGFPYTSEPVRNVHLDARVRVGPGYVTPSIALQGGVEGKTVGPGLSGWMPITDSTNARATWFLRDGPNVKLHSGRFAMTQRLDGRWPVEVEAGGRVAVIWSGGVPEADVEKTGELGVFLRTPYGVNLRIYGEATAADVSRWLTFGELRWRFGG